MSQTQMVVSEAVASKRQVYKVFDKIAHRYDLANRVLSMGQDISWRKKVAQFLPDKKNLALLDLASGTGDLLFSLVRSDKVSSAIGTDMAANMLAFARQKAAKKNLDKKIKFELGDACDLPISSNSFDVVTMAFGIRNVENAPKCLSEINRILTSNGRTIILEFSLPQSRLLRRSYLAYFRHVLPVMGGIISGNYKAYKYLNESVEDFPYGDKFLSLMKKSGLKNLRAISLTFGIATIYLGDKT